MRVFWDPIIIFSRQKLWSFSLRENYLLLYLWSFWVLLHPGMRHESPVTGPLWTQLCSGTCDLTGLCPSHPNKTGLLHIRLGTSLSTPGGQLHLPGLPETVLSWEPSQGAAALQYTARAANGRIFQTSILTQPYLKTKATLCPVKVSVIRNALDAPSPHHHLLIFQGPEAVITR